MKLDPKLGVKKPAFDVLLHLNRQPLPDDKILLADTAAWYNGRERGISLTILPKRNQKKVFLKNLVIVWSECRNSDSIVVYNWLNNTSFNPPTVENFSDKVYRAGEYFSYDHQRDAADYIRRLILDYLKKGS